ncbi:16S rRNA (guanine(966)-N(2))-methyltransferase RsmD [Microvirga sp. W0021]|uniref:16S rRNA (Guanine(966)-N(2))-methyltransferase RsmD n=1 Tax=Hohaiivirga grylli TaxID=3133970 RepID=A0ABV0BGC7_9HYPH
MRVVAGSLKGRALVAPSTEGIRPTSDRLRESIFNILEHAYDSPLKDARVLDLFAGTGAMAIEALSRGASFAVFVDEGAPARSVIRENVTELGLAGKSRLFRRDATRMGDAGSNPPFSVVFCDPPYNKGLAPLALTSCAEGGWLEDGAIIVVEESLKSNTQLPSGFEQIERRSYGETEIIFAIWHKHAHS